MTTAYLNRIAVAVPDHEVHGTFVHFARRLLQAHPRRQALFDRMVDRARIAERFSVLAPAGDGTADQVDADGFYRRGAFPDTGTRMRRYAETAPSLAAAAVGALGRLIELGEVSHLIVTTCTGLMAPGIDLELVGRCGLSRAVSRSVIGFMGCHAALVGLRHAQAIVQSDPAARVLMVNVELCTLHLQETDDLEQILCFLLFGDGCAASLISADPEGLALDRFETRVTPASAEHIKWSIGNQGFDMILTGAVPGLIAESLLGGGDGVFGSAGARAIRHWAAHPGGRSVLDAVERGLDLDEDALACSREVLRRYGNMSSPTIMFVLELLMRSHPAPGPGCALAFGPGLTTEAMLFRVGA